MASKRFKEIKTEVDSLSGAINELNAVITKYKLEGKELSEIQALTAKKTDELAKRFIQVVSSQEKFSSSSRATKKDKEDLQKAVGTLNSKYNGLARTLKTTVSEALSEQSRELKNLQGDLKEVSQAESDWLKNAQYQQKNRLHQIEQERKQRIAARKERIKNFRLEFGDIGRELKAKARLADQTKRAAEANKFFGESFRKAFSPQAIGQAIASVVKFIGIYQILGAAISGVRALTIGAFEEFVKFDKAIGQLSAVTLGTKEEIKQLTSTIKGVAVQTKFTAVQVAELSISLAKLGANSREVGELLLPVSLAAQALGEDLDKVGETIFKVNNQFGISSAESALTAQTLVASINQSALSLNSFSTAIQYIGPIASQIGLSFNDLAGYLETLSDNGFTASRIGTGLRTIFIDLKEQGRPLIDTLRELAEKNISVAEAEELVGKRAAAQLLVLVRNNEELQNGTNINEDFADALSASARQMTTTAGKLAVLDSAYENLRIGIGEVISKSSIFLTIIDALDKKSGLLIRGYNLVSALSTEEDNKYQENLSKLIDYNLDRTKESISTGEALYNAAISSRTQSQKKFFVLLKSLQEEYNLTFEQALDVVETRVLEGQQAAGSLLKEFGLTTQQAGSALRAYYNQWDELNEQLGEFNGAKNIINDQIGATVNGIKIQEKRNEVEKEYIDFLNNLPDNIGEQEKFNKVVEKEIEAREKIKEKTKELNELESKEGFFRDERRIREVTGELAGYEAGLARLSEYTETLIEKDGQRVDINLRNFRIEKKELDLKRKALEDRLKQLEKNLDFEIKAIEARYNREFELAATQEEKAEVTLNRTLALAKAQDVYTQAVTKLTNEVTELTEENDALYSKYRDLFKLTKGTSEEEQKLNEKRRQALGELENAAEQAGQSITQLNLAIVNSQEKLGWDAQKIGNVVLEEGVAILEALGTALNDLNGLYGDSAYEQVKLAEKQREASEIAAEGLAKLKQQYLDLYLVTIATMGQKIADEQFGPILEILQILDKRFNALKQNEIISDEQVKDLKKKFIEIKEGLLNLGIDITWQEAFEQAVNASMEALDRFNQTTFENTKNRLEAEKKAITDAYDTEDAILKSKLDNQLISESEYRSRVKKLREKEAAEQNKIDRQIFNAEKKRDKQKAFTDYVSSLGSIIPNLITTHKVGEPIELSLKYALAAALATFGYSTEVQAINQRQFFPTRFAEGGMVYGPSHEQGGIPFSVSGQAGYEMEGGEYIVNKKATSRYKTLLDQINSYGRSDYKFAAGGIVNSTERRSDKQLEYLEAIAEATVSTAINSSKPVRSFVTSDDLSTNENARRLRQRNTNI